MSLTIRPVDTNYVQQVWPMVQPFLEEAMTKGGDFPDWAQDYTTEHIQSFLTNGAWLLVVAADEENKSTGAQLCRLSITPCTGQRL